MTDENTQEHVADEAQAPVSTETSASEAGNTDADAEKPEGAAAEGGKEAPEVVSDPVEDEAEQPFKLPGADDPREGAPIPEGDEGFVPAHLRFGPGGQIG